ncbi:hypothetical protein JW949_01825 [Candidatus Woesearchaeota archaeon]|nr:hypothetical protein [Candidatus Woesearchaeota archaeon]
MAEDDVPKSIKKFYDKHDKIKKLLDTTKAVHSEAYLKGIEKVGLKDEKGEIDYKKLDKKEYQDNFLKAMVDHYLDKAVESLNLKEKPKDELGRSRILQAYIGITEGQLGDALREAKSDYTIGNHESIRDELIKKQHNELMPIRHAHIKDNDIEDILKHTGVKDYIKKDIQIYHLGNLLGLYREKGEVNLSDLEQLTKLPEEKGGWGKIGKGYLTDKGKENIKKLKDNYKREKEKE